MSRQDEPVRPEARLPKGLFDTSASELRATADMLAKIGEVFERYGFEPLDTPAIEYTDALGKFLPDQDRPNEGVFSFKDDDEQWLSLRYDLTAPLARYVAENYQNLPKPFRRYQVGPVWRNEKPGPGRFRQFTQFDADTVGASSVAADAELCMLAADTLEALGVPRGQYVVKVSNRRILDGVLEAIGLSGGSMHDDRLTVLRAIDKLDRLGMEGVRQLLGKGRKDESGDFTKGAGLDSGRWAPSRRCSVSTLTSRLHLMVVGPPNFRAHFRNHIRPSPTCRLLRRNGRGWGNQVTVRRGWLSRSNCLRPLRRARPRILHRPRVRGRADGAHQR